MVNVEEFICQVNIILVGEGLHNTDLCLNQLYLQDIIFSLNKVKKQKIVFANWEELTSRECALR